MIRNMKPQFLSTTLPFGIALGALIIAGCETTENRISRHPEIYQNLSARDQALVSRSQIRPGMSPNAVWLAWGSPDRKIVGNMRGQATETWVYINYEIAPYSYYPYYGAYGPWGYPYGGSFGFVRTHHRGHSFAFFGSPFYDPFYYSYIPPSIPVPYKVVTFANGRLVSWQHLERS